MYQRGAGSDKRKSVTPKKPKKSSVHSVRILNCPIPQY